MRETHIVAVAHSSNGGHQAAYYGEPVTLPVDIEVEDTHTVCLIENLDDGGRERAQRWTSNARRWAPARYTYISCANGTKTVLVGVEDPRGPRPDHMAACICRL